MVWTVSSESKGVQWGHHYLPETTSALCMGLAICRQLCHQQGHRQVIWFAFCLVIYSEKLMHHRSDVVSVCLWECWGEHWLLTWPSEQQTSKTALPCPIAAAGQHFPTVVYPLCYWKTQCSFVNVCYSALFVNDYPNDQQFNIESASLSNRHSLKQRAWWGRFPTSTSSSSTESVSGM